jgi:DNA-binding response OmpR family regulator
LQEKKILIIDDEMPMLALLEKIFTREGMMVSTATSGEQGLRLLYKERPDLVILDIMMPGLDGIETCRRIRQLADVPIIMLTVRDTEGDMMRSFEAGADDYVTKPFSPDLLLARARAVLRRHVDGASGRQGLYFDDHLSIDLGAHRITVRGRPVKLTPTEFEVLAVLLGSPGRVCSYELILSRVRGEYAGGPEYLHTYIRQLRLKLEPDPARPLYLIGMHGVGYYFEPQKPS